MYEYYEREGGKTFLTFCSDLPKEGGKRKIILFLFQNFVRKIVSERGGLWMLSPLH